MGMLHIMMPYAIIEIITNRKTDTAAAMPVIMEIFIKFDAVDEDTTQLPVPFQLCAHFTEGAFENASLQENTEFDTNLFIALTSDKI